MDIDIRWVGDKYTDIKVSDGSAVIYLGMHDKKEREDLIAILHEAIDDLSRD